MRKYILLGLLAIGCSQKETSEQTTEVSETIETPVESDAKPKTKGKLASEEQLGESLHATADRMRIYEVEWKYDKDSESAATLDYRIAFVKNGKVVKDFTGKIYTDRGAEWGLSPKVMRLGENAENYDPRFVEVSVGYAACGYVWNHFLFFVDGGEIQQVLTNFSMTDSGYGTHFEYLPQMESGKATKFSTVKVAIGEAENSTEENAILEISYSDSTNYVLQNGKWRHNRVTPKEKVYRKKVVAFHEFYKTAE